MAKLVYISTMDISWNGSRYLWIRLKLEDEITGNDLVEARKTRRAEKRRDGTLVGIPRVSSPDPISVPITGCSLRFSQEMAVSQTNPAGSMLFSRNRSKFRARVSTPYETRQVDWQPAKIGWKERR